MIYVDIDGKPVPLKDCCWIQQAPCGCLTAALTALCGGDAYVTEEQAHKELAPTKREREKDVRQGLRFTLMTFDTYRTLNGGRWECGEHKPELKVAGRGE